MKYNLRLNSENNLIKLWDIINKWYINNLNNIKRFDSIKMIK
jgi:hypothetical protein